MPTKTINPLEAWGVVEPNKKIRMLAGTRWKCRQRSAPPSPAKPTADEPREGVMAITVIRAGGFEITSPRTLLAIDWFTEEQRAAYFQRDMAHEVGKPIAPAVAVCRLLSYDEADAECEMSISGYDLPRVSLPKWVLDAKKVKIGERFHWIMRDATYINPSDIDTDIGQAPPQLTKDERHQLDELHKNMSDERARDCGVWEEYSGPGQ